MELFPVLTPKGGPGKTTISTHLIVGDALANPDKRYLLIDLDPQADASSLLLPDYEDFIANTNTEQSTIYAAIVGRAELPIYPTRYHNIDICPSDLILSAAENELTVARDHTEERLMKALEPYHHLYHRGFADCPPNLGILSINALVACQKFIVVTEPGKFALDSIIRLQDIITDLIVGEFGRHIEPLGIVFNKKSPTRASKDTLESLRNAYGDLVCKNVVNRATDIEKAQMECKTIFEFNPESQAAKDLQLLISELFPL
jgi:chromosome partitioning protein